MKHKFEFEMNLHVPQWIVVLVILLIVAAAAFAGIPKTTLTPLPRPPAQPELKLPEPIQKDLLSRFRFTVPLRP